MKYLKPFFESRFVSEDLTMDEQEVEFKKGNGYFDRSDFREIESEFYSCKRLIKSKIEELNSQKIGFNFYMDDNSHLGLYFDFTIRLLGI